MALLITFCQGEDKAVAITVEEGGAPFDFTERRAFLDVSRSPGSTVLFSLQTFGSAKLVIDAPPTAGLLTATFDTPNTDQTTGYYVWSLRTDSSASPGTLRRCLALDEPLRVDRSDPWPS